MHVARVDVSLLDIIGAPVLEWVVATTLDSITETFLTIPGDMTFPFMDKQQRMKLGLTRAVAPVAEVDPITSFPCAADHNISCGIPAKDE